MKKKYILTDETTSSYVTLHRIRAIRDFGNIHAGDLGGWVESEDNLSHSGNAWIFNDAKVFWDGKVLENAMICNKAQVYHHATVSGNAVITNEARVFGNARVEENAMVYDNATICSYAKIYGNACVGGHVMVFDFAEIYEKARILSGQAKIFGHALIHGDATIASDDDFCGEPIEICGGIWKRSPCYIKGSAVPINLAAPDKIACGYETYTFEDWRDNYEWYAKNYNVNKYMQEYIHYFNLLCEISGHEDCKIS